MGWNGRASLAFALLKGVLAASLALLVEGGTENMGVFAAGLNPKPST
jgi:hypothetical protein